MKLNSVILFSENPKKLIEFYKKVLNLEPDWTNGEYSDFKTGSTYFEIGPHDKIHGKNINPERILLIFHVTDVNSEFNRIKLAGAVIIKEPYIPSEDPRLTIATFSDPDGNFFQIMTDWQELATLQHK